MKTVHVDVLQELAGREFPFDIRLKAGELLGMLVEWELKRDDVDREVPLAGVHPFIPSRKAREVGSHPHLPPLA